MSRRSGPSRQAAIPIRFRAGFAFAAVELPGEEGLPLCRLRFTGVLHAWGFARCLASNASYRDDVLPSGLPTDFPEEEGTAGCGG